MKNLVLDGQIVEQGMQVWFNQGGLRDGRMFILESNVVKLTIFAKGHKADVDIELWHKRIDHVNLQKLKGMQ